MNMSQSSQMNQPRKNPDWNRKLTEITIALHQQQFCTCRQHYRSQNERADSGFTDLGFFSRFWGNDIVGEMLDNKNWLREFWGLYFLGISSDMQYSERSFVY